MRGLCALLIGIWLEICWRTMGLRLAVHTHIMQWNIHLLVGSQSVAVPAGLFGLHCVAAMASRTSGNVLWSAGELKVPPYSFSVGICICTLCLCQERTLEFLEVCGLATDFGASPEDLLCA